MEADQVQTPEKNKKTMMIGIIIVVIIVVLGIIGTIIWGISHFFQEAQKNPEEKASEKAAEIIEKQQNMSKKEQINKEERVAEIKSIVNQVMRGNNLNGTSFLKNIMCDLRLSEDEEYFIDVEYNADDYQWNNQITLKESDIKEYKAMRLKCAELFKALFEEDHKIGYAGCKAYLPDDKYAPSFSVIMEGESINQVDWSLDAQTLINQILPQVWQVGYNEYYFYDDDL